MNITAIKEPINASKADLTGSSFDCLSLRTTTFHDIAMQDARFEDIDLSGSTFVKINMGLARFTNGMLPGATWPAPALMTSTSLVLRSATQIFPA